MLMATRTKPEELSARAMQRVLKRAAAAVVAENLDKGIAITVLEEGKIVEISPDGSRTVLREDAPRLVRVSKEPFVLD
jgi:hypothetical protein